MQKPYLNTKYIISITVRDTNICTFHNKTETKYSIIPLFSEITKSTLYTYGVLLITNRNLLSKKISIDKCNFHKSVTRTMFPNRNGKS